MRRLVLLHTTRPIIFFLHGPWHHRSWPSFKDDSARWEAQEARALFAAASPLLEFVDDHETGFIVPPIAEPIAETIDHLSSDNNLAQKIGRFALEKYNNLNLSWSRVVETLVG